MKPLEWKEDDRGWVAAINGHVAKWAGITKTPSYYIYAIGQHDGTSMGTHSSLEGAKLIVEQLVMGMERK